MTRGETKQFLMRISSAYPNWKPQAELKYVIETWWEYLSEYTYEQMKIALKIYISTDTSGFAPSIGQLIDKLHTIGASGELNEMEAWALVSKALRNGYYGAEKEFEKLPPLVQKSVGSPSQLRNWAQTDGESIETVIQSNFIRTYRSILSREKEKEKLPTDVIKLMQKVVNEPAIEQSEISVLSIAEERAEVQGRSIPMPDKVRERLKELLKEY